MEALAGGTFGPSGVDLFFVISGFIMVFTTTGSAITPGRFMRRRIVRVVPLYWLLTLLMVMVALAAPGLFKTLRVSATTLLQSLFFVPHFSQSFPGFVFPLLVPGWTLNLEMFFYVLFAASLWLPEHVRLPVFAGFLVGLVATGAVFGPFGSAPAQTYTSPMLLEFVAGALMAAWSLQGRSIASKGGSLLLMAIGSAMLVLRDTPPLGSGTQIIGATLVVAGALDPAFGRWQSRTLRALGDSSYSLYLTHVFTLGALRAAWVKLLPGAPNLFSAILFMLLALVCCAMVGWLSYRWIESPVLRRLTRRRVDAVVSRPEREASRQKVSEPS